MLCTDQINESTVTLASFVYACVVWTSGLCRISCPIKCWVSLWRSWQQKKKKTRSAQVVTFMYILFFEVTLDSMSDRRLTSAPFVFSFFLQLDADRDEEEVFCDISMTLDNKLFPSSEPAAGETQIMAESSALAAACKNRSIEQISKKDVWGRTEPQPKCHNKQSQQSRSCSARWLSLEVLPSRVLQASPNSGPTSESPQLQLASYYFISLLKKNIIFCKIGSFFATKVWIV